MLAACCRIEVIVNTTSTRCDFLTDEIALADCMAVVFKIPKDVRRSRGSQYNTIVAGLFNGRSRMLGAALDEALLARSKSRQRCVLLPARSMNQNIYHSSSASTVMYSLAMCGCNRARMRLRRVQRSLGGECLCDMFVSSISTQSLCGICME